MPSRNRAREAARAASGDSPKDERKKPDNGKRAGKKPKKPSTASPKPPRRQRTGPMFDPSAADDAQTRFIQPYEATKTYICPGCNRDIPPGAGHLVAVPPDDPDLRRHWHRGCWTNRHSRF